MQGDTIKGYVDFKEWGTSPTKFNFKSAITGEASIYTADNAKAFGITGYEYYKLFNITVSQAKLDVSQLTQDVDTTSIAGTYFLKLITTGSKLSMYSYDNGYRPHFYVADGNANPVELIIRSYLDPQENSKIITQYTYRRQLQTWAYMYKNDDHQLKQKIAQANYNAGQIASIIDNINGPGNRPIKQYNKSSSPTRFFVGAGAVSTDTKFSGEIEFAGQSHSAVFPALAAGLDFFSNKNVGNLIFRFELGFSGNKASFTQNNPQETTVSATSNLSFNQYIVFFNPQVLYNFYNTDATKVYFAIGAVINYAAYSNKSYVITLNDGFAPETPSFPDVQSTFYSLSGKVGLVISKKLDVYVGYNPSTAISDNVGYHASLTQYKFGLNYLFN
jgi:hypothetical protein